MPFGSFGCISALQKLLQITLVRYFLSSQYGVAVIKDEQPIPWDWVDMAPRLQLLVRLDLWIAAYVRACVRACVRHRRHTAIASAC